MDGKGKGEVVNRVGGAGGVRRWHLRSDVARAEISSEEPRARDKYSYLRWTEA